MKFNTGIQTRTRKQAASGGGSGFGRNYVIVEVQKVVPNQDASTNSGYILGTLPFGQDPTKVSKYVMNQESFIAATKSEWAKDAEFMGGMIDGRMVKHIFEEKKELLDEESGNTKLLVIMEGVNYLRKDKELNMDVYETRYVNNVPSSAPNKIVNGVIVARSRFDADAGIAQIKSFGCVVSSNTEQGAPVQAFSIDDDFKIAAILDEAANSEKDFKDNYAFILRATAELAEPLPTQSSTHKITHVVAHQTPPLWFTPTDESELADGAIPEFKPLTGSYFLDTTANYSETVKEYEEELLDWLRKDGYEPVSIQPEIVLIRLYTASPKFRKFKLNPEKDKSPFFRMTNTYTGLDFNENPDEAEVWRGLNYGGYGTLVITADEEQVIKRREIKIIEQNIVANAFLHGYVNSVHDFVSANGAQAGCLTRLAKSLAEVEQYRPGQEDKENTPEIDNNELSNSDLSEVDGDIQF